MYKVYIEKRELREDSYYGDEILTCELETPKKPEELTDNEWIIIEKHAIELSTGKRHCYKHILGQDCYFDLYCIIDDNDWNVLAESKNYFIKNDYEEAFLYRKNDLKIIASVGHFYGDPEDAYIDPEEKFCITVGCGLIKYNLTEPFESYMYDRNTSQWIEAGREGDIEWCDCIEEVTDSYIIVSSEGEDRRRFKLETLEKEELI